MIRFLTCAAICVYILILLAGLLATGVVTYAMWLDAGDPGLGEMRPTWIRVCLLAGGFLWLAMTLVYGMALCVLAAIDRWMLAACRKPRQLTGRTLIADLERKRRERPRTTALRNQR